MATKDTEAPSPAESGVPPESELVDVQLPDAAPAAAPGADAQPSALAQALPGELTAHVLCPRGRAPGEDAEVSVHGGHRVSFRIPKGATSGTLLEVRFKPEEGGAAAGRAAVVPDETEDQQPCGCLFGLGGLGGWLGFQPARDAVDEVA